MLASRLPCHAGEGLGGLDFYVGFAIISVEDAGADASIDPVENGGQYNNIRGKHHAIRQFRHHRLTNLPPWVWRHSHSAHRPAGTRELLIAAHKAGINYIDTARAYTVSEAWIGQSLEEAGLRDDFILATKCRALTKADMEAEIATSLKNLRTDHIELFQFHNPSLDGLKTILAPGGAMEALLEAKARGIVRHIGITAHLPPCLRPRWTSPRSRRSCSRTTSWSSRQGADRPLRRGGQALST